MPTPEPPPSGGDGGGPSWQEPIDIFIPPTIQPEPQPALEPIPAPEPAPEPMSDLPPIDVVPPAPEPEPAPAQPDPNLLDLQWESDFNSTAGDNSGGGGGNEMHPADIWFYGGDMGNIQNDTGTSDQA